MSLAAGTRVGPYEILGLTGAGGMGEVYKARDTRLDRPVAIKILPADISADPTRRALFEREAKATAALSHPNIVDIHDVGAIDGIPYLVEEWLEGESLRQRLRRGAIQERGAVEIAMQVAHGLAAAHGKGIVHRDIKPENLFLTTEGTVKILDFGVARLTEPAASGDGSASTTVSCTAPGMVRGTPGYMAPEQARGLHADHRADVFAFGCVLYEMLSGAPAFSGDTPSDALAALLTTEPPALDVSGRSVSPALQEIVRRCLDKEPNQRFSSAHDLGLSLRAISGSRTVGGRPGVGSWFSHHRALVAGTTSVLAVAVAVFVWTLGSGPVLSFAPRDWVLVADVDNETGESIFDRSLTTAFVVSLEQSTHANVFPRSRIAATLRRMGKPDGTAVDEAIGREICVREHVRGLISSAISKVGRAYSLTARIVDPATGETVRSYIQEAGGQDEVLSVLGALAADIRRDLGESLSSIEVSNRKLPQVTTSSLEALGMYADGSALWSRGKYDQAVQLYSSALKADPDFALAHAALGVAYYSHIYNKPFDGKAHLERARQLSHRTTQREAQTIEITYEVELGHYDNARTLYEIYLKTYPDDAAMRYNYAGALRNHGEHETAVAQYLEVLRVAPNEAGALINLATSYSSLDKPRDALNAYARAFELQPEWITAGNLNHEYGFAWVQAGDLAKAEEVFNKGLSGANRPLSTRSLALLDMYRGKYGQAIDRLREAILLNQSAKSPLSESRNQFFLATAHEALGEGARSLGALDKAARCLEETKGQVWLVTRIGIGFARGGSLARAEQMLGKARAEAELSNPQHASDLHRLEGEIEAARGAHAKAIDVLLLADREHHWPLTQESLARAYRLSRDPVRALEAYRTVAAMGYQSLGWEAQQGWLEGNYWLASFYGQRGARKEAVTVLDTMLARWSEADRDLPLLNRALQLRTELARQPPPN